MKRFLLSEIACYSLQDILNAKCEVLCQRDGYNSGIFSKNSCMCSDNKGKIDDFIKRHVDLGSQDMPDVKPSKILTYISPWSDPDR